MNWVSRCPNVAGRQQLPPPAGQSERPEVGCTASLILVVEDDHRTFRMLEFKLVSLGHEVIRAVDGRGALGLAARESPDLVLLDVMMPVMDGFQVLQTLKSQEGTKDIPVIILTAKGQEKDIVTGIEAGAVDYVTKPFSFAELIARVNRALASSQ